MEKTVDKITKVLDEDTAFTENTHLGLKYTDRVLKQRQGKYIEVLNAVQRLDDKFIEAIKLLDENAKKIDPKALSNELREVANKLEGGVRQGKEAEKLLREAQLQGEKEAEAYLKALKPKVIVVQTPTVEVK